MLASAGLTLPRRSVPRPHADTSSSHAAAARWSAATRPHTLPAPHLLRRARAPARRSPAAVTPRATVEGLFGAKTRAAPRVAPAILPVRQPSVLELALSTELISATLSVPIALFAYRPLCAALGALLSGATVADNVLSYYVTLVGLLFGFIVSNTFYFLCASCHPLLRRAAASAARAPPLCVLTCDQPPQTRSRRSCMRRSMLKPAL